MAYQITGSSSSAAICIESDDTFSKLGLTKFYSGIICQAVKDACEPVGAKELRPLLHRCPLETHMTSGLDAVFFLFMAARDEKYGTRFERYMIELDRDPGTSRKKLMLYGDISGAKSKSRRNPGAVNLRKRLRFLRDQIRRSKANANEFDSSNSAATDGIQPQRAASMDDQISAAIDMLFPVTFSQQRQVQGEIRG